MGCTSSDMRHEGNDRYRMREIMQLLRNQITELDNEKKIVSALEKTGNIYTLKKNSPYESKFDKLT
jgi:hypothetical protein